MNYLYIASPYSDPSSFVRDARFDRVTAAAANLYYAGVTVVSPIVHCHPLAKALWLPGGSDFWGPWNEAVLSKAAGILLFKDGGHDSSEGIRKELKTACKISQDFPVLEAFPSEVSNHVATTAWVQEHISILRKLDVYTE